MPSSNGGLFQRDVQTIAVLGSMLVGLGFQGCNCGGPSADSVAIEVSGLGAAGFNYTQGTYVIGFAFRAKNPITISELGYYDSNLTGETETFSDHAVGVYDLSTHALLGSDTVRPSDPVTGLFRYVALSSPIALNTTDVYAIVGVSGTNYYTVGIASAEAPVNAALNFLGGGGYSASGTNNNPTQTSVLIEPNAFDAGNIFGEVPPEGTMCNFGSNFMFHRT